MIVAILMVGIGGAYVRGANMPCPNGTEMSHQCLFQQQEESYRDVYIFHFVGLAWLVAAWIMDGVQLWHWIWFRVEYHEEERCDARLQLFFSRQYLASPVYSTILALTVVLVTCSWTLIFTDWTTDVIDVATGETGITKLAQFLLLEILSCAAASAVVLNLLRLCSKHRDVTHKVAT